MTPSALALPAWIKAAPEVAEALARGRPVVALESTVITHGLPRPLNRDVAQNMEAAVRSHGACPATIAILDGQPRLGLTPDELERLALSTEARKVSLGDLGIAVARGEAGGTTVAATITLAHIAGIRVFATGGIGGVHRGDASDISADLPGLAHTPIAVVCAGAKAILDLPRTLEWLETAGVPIVGWQTDDFPAFYSRSSGLSVSARADRAEEVAAILHSHWQLGLHSSVLVCVPCPEQSALPGPAAEASIEQSLAEAAAAGVRGQDLTPFLLARLAELTQGKSLRANIALLLENAHVAAQIACALEQLHSPARVSTSVQPASDRLL